MTAQQHRYATTVTWTGNPGGGTNRRGNHSRNHEIGVQGKPAIPASSDPAFRGDPTRYNPEDLLVASLSACHMLWFLSLCGKAGIAVTGYVDHAEGTMEETPSGGGHFTLVVLRPEITLAPGADRARADALHHEAHEKCFVSQSVNFPVTVEATYREDRL
jgi:organic hydroperoxide reductase OsmC/OhrA